MFITSTAIDRVENVATDAKKPAWRQFAKKQPLTALYTTKALGRLLYVLPHKHLYLNGLFFNSIHELVFADFWIFECVLGEKIISSNMSCSIWRGSFFCSENNRRLWEFAKGPSWGAGLWPVGSQLGGQHVLPRQRELKYNTQYQVLEYSSTIHTWHITRVLWHRYLALVCLHYSIVYSIVHTFEYSRQSSV